MVGSALLAGAAPSSLFDELDALTFLNEGVTTAADRFHWEPIMPVGAGQKLIYLEAENVSCAPCSKSGAGWSDEYKYYAPHPYMFKDRSGETGGGGGGGGGGEPGVYGGDTPPSGLRSAVPLGGIGAGSVELRGDGTLHEWTIQNANPMAAAKVQQYPFAHFALAVGGVGGVGGEKRLLQTNPALANEGDAALGGAGVRALRYAGAHPVSRLDVLDDGLLGGGGVNASLFAYSVFKHNDPEASARPAAAFTLALRNGGAAPAEVRFMLQLPHRVEHDQTRIGSPLPAAAQPSGAVADGAACAQACTATAACRSWVLARASGACTLQSDAPLNRYLAGSSSGIAAVWAAADEAAQCLTLVAEGSGPMHGDMSLCAAAEGGSAADWGFFTADDPAAAFAAFAPGASSPSAAAATANSNSSSSSSSSSSSNPRWQPLGNGDWNDPSAVLVSGTDNIVGSHEECEGQCDVVPHCTTGLYLAGTTRHGECWLASAQNPRGPILDFCGKDVTQTCYAFGSGGTPPPTPVPPTPPPTPAPAPALRGVYGSVWVGATVPAGATATLSLTLGWSFPHRDNANYDHTRPEAFAPFGNQYAKLFPRGSKQAAWGEAAPAARGAALAQVVADVRALHEPFTASSLPPYLADLLVNSLSHTRNAMWFARCPHCHASADPRVNGTAGRGFFRQFEANDCADMDSIHNDGERHVPYLMFLPDHTRSKLAAWAGNQGAGGMLAEQIQQTDPDGGYGRVMSDGSSMFILYVLELLRWGGDGATAALYYPTVKRAAQWQIKASAAIGLPYKLETTYDILKFPDFDYSAYASVFHLAAMRAAAELADEAGDAAFAATCRAALLRGQTTFDAVHWNASAGHYNAASSGCAENFSCKLGVGLFSDTFYAQVLGYSLWGEGGLLTPSEPHLRAHLAAESEQNCVSNGPGAAGALRPGVCPNGLVIMTKRPVQLTDLQVWEMAPHDHAALALRVNASAAAPSAAAVGAALRHSEASGTSYSQRLNDQWNYAGIKSNDGFPTITSHYGYHMTAWHLPMALSGQAASLGGGGGNRTLTFAPRQPCPFVLPVLLVGRLGTLSCSNGGDGGDGGGGGGDSGDSGGGEAFTLTLVSGEQLELDTLAVNARAYPGTTATLAVGSPLHW